MRKLIDISDFATIEMRENLDLDGWGNRGVNSSLLRILKERKAILHNANNCYLYWVLVCTGFDEFVEIV